MGMAKGYNYTLSNVQSTNIPAHHLAILSDDATTKRLHQKLSVGLRQKSSLGWKAVKLDGIIDEAKEGVQRMRIPRL